MKNGTLQKKWLKILRYAVIFTLLFATNLYAEEGWEMVITVSVLDVQNRLVIGQKNDARDQIDGRYDVPAMLTGDMTAYLNLEGSPYWKDVRQTCDTRMNNCKITWKITVETKVIEKIIGLKWQMSKILRKAELTLIDLTADKIIDMKSEQEYKYKNTGKREFIVEMEAW